MLHLHFLPNFSSGQQGSRHDIDKALVILAKAEKKAIAPNREVKIGKKTDIASTNYNEAQT